MVGYNLELVLIEEESLIEIDRLPINYDPCMEVGDVFMSYNDKSYTITSKQKYLDSKKDKMYYVYFVNDIIDSKSTTVLSFID